MLLEAMAATGVHDRACCIFVGDSDTDMQVRIPCFSLRLFLLPNLLRLSDKVLC
jgi:hypothetical protein